MLAMRTVMFWGRVRYALAWFPLPPRTPHSPRTSHNIFVSIEKTITTKLTRHFIYSISTGARIRIVPALTECEADLFPKSRGVNRCER
jgi:hypothetical protein